MTLKRPGAPLFRWYFLAIFTAVSTASDPPLTKKTRDSLSGASPATLAASFTVAGPTLPPGVKLMSCICSYTASAISFRPWPMFFNHIPEIVSNQRLPSTSSTQTPWALATSLIPVSSDMSPI